MSLEKLSPSFPQGVSPHTPLPQEPSAQILSSKYQVLSTRQKRQIVGSTGLADSQWLAWHCVAVKKLGPTLYLDLADMAKDGEKPETLFVWLIGEELARK